MSRKIQLAGASTRSRLRRPGRRVSLQYPTDSVDNISEVSCSLGDKADTDEENDCNDDLYIVDKIIGQRIISDGSTEFEVKWKKCKTSTWEPENSLKKYIPRIIAQYKKRINGRQRDGEKKSGKRPVADLKGHPTKRRKLTPGSSSNNDLTEWKPPLESWDDKIQSIDTIEKVADGKLVSYVTWVDGKKTKQDIYVLFNKCPQKTFQYLVRHIVVRPETNTQDEAAA
ncbi:hypothetical protein H633G_11255 [Metarhizium anisopliae BRIP 53284]|nr:hypothetical protein H633G_11255 [Metarhizium anisopliae BRIP 53284]